MVKNGNFHTLVVFQIFDWTVEGGRNVWFVTKNLKKTVFFFKVGDAINVKVSVLIGKNIVLSAQLGVCV